MTDNHDLLLLRGRYVTMQDERRKLAVEIQALAERMAANLQTYRYYDNNIHAGAPDSTALREAMDLAPRLQEALERSQGLIADMARIKPMTGL